MSWISVDERLPPTLECVMGWVRDDPEWVYLGPDGQWYMWGKLDGTDEWIAEGCLLYWQPLPEPPA